MSARIAYDRPSKIAQPLWEISSQPILVTGNEPDPNNRRILYANQAFTRRTGFPEEETIGQSPDFLHGPNTDLNILRSSEKQFRTGRPHEYSLLHYRKDGSPYQCTVTRAPLIDLDGVSEYLISMYMAEQKPSSEAAPGFAMQKDSVPLTIPMPLREYPDGRLPEHLLSHPELDALLDLWLEIRSTRALPNRKDFTLDIMARWAPHLSVALVTAENRIQFRLFGTALTRVYGRDLTGCFIDDLTPLDLWSVVTEHYGEVIKRGQPLFAPISVSNGRWYT